MTITGNPGGMLVYILYFFILLPIFLFTNNDSNKSKLIFLRVNAFNQGVRIFWFGLKGGPAK